jgi:hypothetical protein
MCTQAAWCPPLDSRSLVTLDSTSNFTLFFRVDGSFAGYNGQFNTSNSTIFNYNLFYLSDLIAYSQGENFSTQDLLRRDMSAFDSVLETGTVIYATATIRSNANYSTRAKPKPCSLDVTPLSPTPNCVIDISFKRIDPSDSNAISHGYNFYYASPWSLSESASRVVTKVYGTRIIFSVAGIGAQFDPATLAVR